ncbi:acylamino-acid-releasing enzyme [Phytophthora infestans T30-4]|uniref:Acylamino-acid-releasing enzyme n=1 Tax=Phytophthora infestans (strain T30-4) TaxID=403677 RepID=D0N7W1_PHYIT|nr:acylamino-acid-releasing enzyme [Phytophthora infestans T30-4]EEY53660.1 acylamino-acid-releasing enzyme [Phytophthora infestans T30-4]|eukprot:XP_002905278.1 acylamino-acid-releasing enzyme [Phytophthora infestans T30-4]
MTTDSTEHQRVSELFAEVVSSSKSLVGGYLSIDAASDSASVQLIWDKTDLVNNVTHKFQTHHHVSSLTQTQPKVLDTGFPTDWSSDYTSVSPSGKRGVTLKLEKSKGDSSVEGVFCVFEANKLVSSFKTPKTLHGAIYLGEREGGIAWSHDEKTIAYVAEKKVTESPAFWENINSKKEKKEDDKESKTPLPGSKFEYVDDWGEQYEGKKTASIFLATVATGKIDQVKNVSENLTCADVAFVPGDNELVFAATETDNPKRLGIIYCYNRPITLYHAVLNKKDQTQIVVTKLEFISKDKESEEIGTMRNPRFSPDGKQLAFLATRDVATHGTCSFLCVMDWDTKQTSTVIPIKDEPDASELDVTKAFNGLFMGSLRKNAWSEDGKYILVVTQVGSRVLWKYVEVATKTLISPEYVDGSGVAVESVLDRKDDYYLVMVSSPTRPASVYLVHIDPATGKYLNAPIILDDQKGVTQYIKRWEVYSIPASVSDIPAADKKLPGTPSVLKNLLIPSTCSSSDYEATVMLPSSTPPTDGYPVILELHGGPHGNSPVMYRHMCDFWAALGFAIVTVNYRGSTGFGIKALESLIGKVGTQDVYDCHYALCYLLEKSSRLGLSLDKSRVHCSGGSHGGFLVTHLIAQFPGFYKSMVTRNPVTNLSSVFYTSDIQDWGLACAGIQRFESIHTSQKLQNSKDKLPPLSPDARLAILSKLWQHSPVSNDLSKVTTPSLFGLGGKDKRVPPNQGLEYRATISSYGVPTQLLWYPEDSHPLGSVEATGDFAVNWGLWLLKHNPK